MLRSIFDNARRSPHFKPAEKDRYFKDLNNAAMQNFAGKEKARTNQVAGPFPLGRIFRGEDRSSPGALLDCARKLAGFEPVGPARMQGI